MKVFLTVYMIWGIISTMLLFLGFVAGVYMFCTRRKNRYIRIPSTPVTGSPSIPLTQFSPPTLTPPPSPVRNPTPTRLPCLLVEEEEEYEQVGRRTATKRKHVSSGRSN